MKLCVVTGDCAYLNSVWCTVAALIIGTSYIVYRYQDPQQIHLVDPRNPSKCFKVECCYGIQVALVGESRRDNCDGTGVGQLYVRSTTVKV